MPLATNATTIATATTTTNTTTITTTNTTTITTTNNTIAATTALHGRGKISGLATLRHHLPTGLQWLGGLKAVEKGTGCFAPYAEGLDGMPLLVHRLHEYGTW
ncbi:hypothetical protein E2C01_052050 [Portunus trituberculatus]|uniref:Uncharacterized protein n=1 Tax=Portunus trituberculatus TaxID=210409 RepID=A0A5B7GKX5_PORTR|nr:hypothetical protein [Portunus trituberculatus]